MNGWSYCIRGVAFQYPSLNQSQYWSLSISACPTFCESGTGKGSIPECCVYSFKNLLYCPWYLSVTRVSSAQWSDGFFLRRSLSRSLQQSSRANKSILNQITTAPAGQSDHGECLLTTQGDVAPLGLKCDESMLRRHRLPCL